MAKNQKKTSLYPLRREKPKGQSEFYKNWQILIPVLKRKYFYKENVSIAGDAPKNFIRIYEYGNCRKDKKSTWIAYIAKVGHKWYPVESITEYLMNRIGESIGVNVAESKLMLAGGQIRFLSKFFIDRDSGEELFHGAQIYAAYLGDEKFVDLANERKEREISRELFSFQFTEESIKNVFVNEWEEIMENYVTMLVFDAIVGNNDRHFYNWGVIKSVFGNKKPKFSPIYDTARGLFWNVDERSLEKYKDIKLKKYIDNAMPRTGWDNCKNVNHFELIGKIFHEDQRYCDICKNIINKDTYSIIESMILKEFTELLSEKRLNLILKCIKLRVDNLLNSIY